MKSLKYINKFEIFMVFAIILMSTHLFATINVNKIDDKIVKINYIGNDNISAKKINKILNVRINDTKKYKDGFNVRIIKLEKEKIKYLYISKGYINCSVMDSLFIDSNNQLNINYTIREGEKYLLNKLSFIGNKVLEKEDILAILDLQFNKYFDIFSFKDKLKLLENKYGQLGYAYVKINYEMNNDPNLEIIIKIDEGEKYFIKDIDIKGLKKVKYRTIKKQLNIKSEDRYDLDKIKQSRRRIIELGMFNSVNIVPKNRNIDSQYVDLSVKVSEALEHRWDANIGFRQGRVEFVDYSYLFSKIDWTHKNIFNRAHRLSISSSINLLLSQISDINNVQFSYDAQLSYRVPIIWKYHLPTTISLYHKKDVYSPFNKIKINENDELITKGLSVSSNYNPNRKFQISIGYTLREIESILSQERSEIQNKISIILKYDNRDNFLYPHNGWNVRSYTNFVNSFKGNYSQYIQWEMSVSKYFSIFNKSVLAGRFAIGETYNFSDYDPLTALFRMGTATSVRGWAQSIGNEYLTTDSLTVYAGYNKILANLEYRIPLFWILGAEIFVDAGQLRNDFTGIFQSNEFYVSAGGGIRIESPVGPIRFEMPFVVNDPSGRKKFGEQTEIKIIIAILFAY